MADDTGTVRGPEGTEFTEAKTRSRSLSPSWATWSMT